MANGVYTNSELVDTLIIDCSNAVKSCMEGQYIQFCNIMVQMVQKLANLKIGIKNDIENRDEIIENLKDELRKAGHDVIDFKPEEIEKYIGEKQEKDGEKNA